MYLRWSANRRLKLTPNKTWYPSVLHELVVRGSVDSWYSRHRVVLLAVYNMIDIINHRLYLNPIADFEFGINAAIIRPENIEPPLIKGT
jgi:hypothetical protein